MTALLPILSRLWPYLAGAALIIGAWAWADHRGYQRGEADCDARWRVAQAEAQRQANQRAADREAIKNQSNKQAAEKIDVITRTEVRYVDRIKEIYRDRDDPLCVGADGMRLIADADRDRAAVAQPTGNGPG